MASDGSAGGAVARRHGTRGNRRIEGDGERRDGHSECGIGDRGTSVRGRSREARTWPLPPFFAGVLQREFRTERHDAARVDPQVARVIMVLDVKKSTVSATPGQW